jgi:hypothetical protein
VGESRENRDSHGPQVGGAVTREEKSGGFEGDPIYALLSEVEGHDLGGDRGTAQSWAPCLRTLAP